MKSQPLTGSPTIADLWRDLYLEKVIAASRRRRKAVRDRQLPGGSWLTALASDLGAGKLDGAQFSSLQRHAGFRFDRQ